ncbi:divalent metal cation transporter [Alteromonas sediminis]|uniref:Divalent metal cation transporter n=1 Tax=Alteromonas sediminis TaxID=2259342 RepID=A0A3N5Y617_9ALTE|nr:Nramp family divalent metal transporter [Alteromonas sediminis]RPJ65779.1 divalent metal cation transporter [Alteromonas sediminis]
MMKNKTGLIIAAAFIGPGTVTTASMAGAQMGLHLAWALIFSVVSTVVLQDMVIRLGFATRQGLSEAILAVFSHPLAKGVAGLLVLAAIGVGNAAYQSGNLTGAGLGLASLGTGTAAQSAGLIGGLALALLFSGSYKYIERVLVALVIIMSLVFVTTLFFASPDWAVLFSQLLSPSLSTHSLSLALALIGTTIVPYNLFLHASLTAHSNATDSQPLIQTRKDSALAITIGGLITLVIMTTAAMTFFTQGEPLSADNIGKQLEPVLGQYATTFFSLGLFAAGLTSAITAPLAAGYALSGLFGWQSTLSSAGFRFIVTTIILTGTLFAVFGTQPLTMILVAQVTNALLLPLVVALLIGVMNRHQALSQLRNPQWLNIVALICLTVITVLAFYKLM